MRRYVSVVLLLLLAECFLLPANSSSVIVSTPCIERERQALLEFKASLQKDPSNRLSSWKETTTNCCDWEGVGCDNVTGYVVKLDLRNPCFARSWPEPEEEFVAPYYLCNYYLYGHSTVPLELKFAIQAPNVSLSLSRLEHLTYLDLTGNDFNSTPIPDFIGNSMGGLRYLSLSTAYFSGRIPSSLRNLKNLHLLDLGANLDLQTDDISWISQLQLLQYLDMSYVYLGDVDAHKFQVLTMIPSLSSLHLQYCGLNNSLVHINAFQNITYLVHLDLSNNGIYGPISNAFRNMSSLVHLDLTGNYLDSIPPWFGSLNLVYLDLSSTGLHGPIPNVFRNMSSLMHLDLSNNDLGSVPSWFSCSKLRYLGLWGTGLHGPIPESFRNMTSIQTLFLYNNKITSIPSWFVEFKTLLHLDLSNNELIPSKSSLASILSNMCHLKSLYFSGNKLREEPIASYQLSRCFRYDLEALDLSDNQFSDPLPSWLGKLENLEHIYLSSNFFFGPLPLFLGKLQKLKYLDLSYNKLDGALPNCIGQLVNLVSLDLSSNQIYGVIPQNLNQLVNLVSLNLSSNKFYGSISQSIGEHVNLQTLDLSLNNLSGEIPNCWKDNKRWREINFSSNKLSGVFPSSLGNLSSLLWLHLNNNILQGELPVSLRNLKKLLILDLGDNQFSGSIPSSWIGNTFPSLHILKLRQNVLSGSIPFQLCQLTSLRILDLSLNKLQGSIPLCIGNLKGMTRNKSSGKANEKLISEKPFLRTTEELEWLSEEVKSLVSWEDL